MKLFMTALVAGSLTLPALPALAQDEPEEPRKTWQVSLIDVADGKMDRYQELVLDHMVKAHAAAGLPAPQVHWLMATNDYDMLIITEMPDGMATFDSHQPASRVALRNALISQEGSEAAMEAMFEELNGLENKSVSYFTHSHP